MSNGNSRARFCYAVSITIMVFGRTSTHSVAVVQREAIILPDWANSNAANFDPRKKEAVQIYGRQREKLVSTLICDKRVEPKNHKIWLGIQLEFNSTFK